MSGEKRKIGPKYGTSMSRVDLKRVYIYFSFNNADGCVRFISYNLNIWISEFFCLDQDIKRMKGEICIARHGSRQLNDLDRPLHTDKYIGL